MGFVALLETDGESLKTLWCSILLDQTVVSVSLSYNPMFCHRYATQTCEVSNDLVWSSEKNGTLWVVLPEVFSVKKAQHC